MTKLLDDAVAQVKELPPDRQNEIAEVLLDLIGGGESDPTLSPEQIAEIERRLSDDEPFAGDDEVRRVLDRLTR